jgi:hypothetical protein
VADPLFGQRGGVPKRNPTSIGARVRTTKTRSTAVDPFVSRPRPSVIAVTSDPGVGNLAGIRPKQKPPRRFVPEKRSALESPSQADPNLVSLKSELALWRAFLGEEIDAILRDKD